MPLNPSSLVFFLSDQYLLSPTCPSKNLGVELNALSTPPSLVLPPVPQAHSLPSMPAAQVQREPSLSKRVVRQEGCVCADQRPHTRCINVTNHSLVERKRQEAWGQEDLGLNPSPAISLL